MVTNHFNQLSEAEHERLALLIEECLDVAKAGAKILLHGYTGVGEWETNRELLEKDIADLLRAAIMASDAEDFSMERIKRLTEERKVSAAYLHHQPPIDMAQNK